MPPPPVEEGIVFLTVDDALEIQKRQIARYGGGPDGVLNWPLLDSAVNAPRATFDGCPLYAFPFEMAAVYMIHIIKNHPLRNGNKRTGSVAAIDFLGLNGYELKIAPPQLRELALRAEAGAGKQEIAKALEALYLAAQGH